MNHDQVNMMSIKNLILVDFSCIFVLWLSKLFSVHLLLQVFEAKEYSNQKGINHMAFGHDHSLVYYLGEATYPNSCFSLQLLSKGGWRVAQVAKPCPKYLGIVTYIKCIQGHFGPLCGYHACICL